MGNSPPPPSTREELKNKLQRERTATEIEADCSELLHIDLASRIVLFNGRKDIRISDDYVLKYRMNDYRSVCWAMYHREMDLFRFHVNLTLNPNRNPSTFYLDRIVISRDAPLLLEQSFREKVQEACRLI